MPLTDTLFLIAFLFIIIGTFLWRVKMRYEVEREDPEFYEENKERL